MCRVMGVIFGPGGPEAEEFTPAQAGRRMLPALVKGGPHAYGWMTWNGEGDIIRKRYVGRSDIPRNARRIQAPRNARWFIGHTRYATHGSPKHEWNNHPIVHGDIMGIHNGVLRNHESILSITGREDERSEVDSEAIFAAVHKWGIEEGLRSIVGDMVTVFVDQRDPEVINIARSYGRPLVMAWTKNGSLVFASEKQALDKLGVPLTEYTTTLGDNRLLQVRDGVIFNRSTYREEPKPVHVSTTSFRGNVEVRYSASATRRAMMQQSDDEVDAMVERIEQASMDQERLGRLRRNAKNEIEAAREFIAQERQKAAEKAAARRKTKVGADEEG